MASKNLVSKEEEFKSEFKRRVKDEAKMLYRKTLDEVSDRHKFVCVAYAVKDIVIDQWIATQKAYDKADGRTLYFYGVPHGKSIGQYDNQFIKQK